MSLRRNVSAVAVAALATGALVLSACSGEAAGGNTNAPPAIGAANTLPAPGDDAGAAGGAGSVAAAPAATFKACMVTDVGGINDGSFNQSAWEGMQAVRRDGKAKVIHVRSKTAADYTTNINDLLSQHCDLIVTVGSRMGAATSNAAKAHPNQHFAEVDHAGNGKNMVGLRYNAAEGAFLGGYLAAGYTKTGKVAVYGGHKLAPVTAYMDGYYDGVQYYNSEHGTHVQVLGWSEQTQRGTFAGSVTNAAEGRQLAKNFLRDGADIIFAAAGAANSGTATGAVNSGAAAAVRAEGKSVLIWANSDGCISAKKYCDLCLTSVTKNVAGSVQQVVEQAAADRWTGKDYIGTLNNNGTGLAPFHNFENNVPPKLKSEIAKVKQAIIDGSVKVASPSQPKAGA